MDTDVIHLRVIVTGVVQGVFFRASTMEQAQARALTGSVANLPDGAVEVDVQGDRAAVETFIQWLHRGPPSARVESVHVTAKALDDALKTFRVQ